MGTLTREDIALMYGQFHASKAGPDYNLHGSMKNYQVMSTGKSQPLKANDIVTLFFRAHSASGANSNATSVDLKCRVS